MSKWTNITQEYLFSILDYDKNTGFFTWKHRNNVGSAWNTRYAYKIAGGLNPTDGYWYIAINKKLHSAHRLAWIYCYGDNPKEHLDHINLDKKDNKIENLRIASVINNSWNIGKKTNNKLGLKGVSRHSYGHKWQVFIVVNKERNYLGLYDCPAAASFAYQIASDIHFGEFARAF
jgi:hypothetical protein